MDDDGATGLYSEAIHAFLRLHRYLRKYSRRIQDQGISGRKLAALRYLLEASPRTVGQLSDYHDINDSSASEMVAQLCRLGYVTRSRSEDDQRVVLVELTAEGREFALRAPLGGIPLLRERLRAAPPPQLSMIRDALVALQRMVEIEDGD